MRGRTKHRKTVYIKRYRLVDADEDCKLIKYFVNLQSAQNWLKEQGYSCLQANEDTEWWQRPFISKRVTVQLRSNYYLIKEDM